MCNFGGNVEIINFYKKIHGCVIVSFSLQPFKGADIVIPEMSQISLNCDFFCKILTKTCQCDSILTIESHKTWFDCKHFPNLQKLVQNFE